MKARRWGVMGLAGLLLLPGCGTYPRRGMQVEQARQWENDLRDRAAALIRENEDRILALNPLDVSAADVQGVLARAPAPRIISIHGGFARVIPFMISFTEFIVGMGYPAASVTNAADGTYTFSCYEDSEVIAGLIAWYYEKEGLRPMLVGHSQGGIQAVKVLRRLSRPPTRPVAVWNPLTWQPESRDQIIDPLTQQPRPVAGLRLAYATALCAGGTGRIPPNQWDMLGSLRSIPESVEEFTGYYKTFDLLGGDFLGFSSPNPYKAAGQTVVRNVRLPSSYDHSQIPDTRHLLKNPAMVDWINAYRPADEPPPEPAFAGDSRHILWAADVWYSLKKHWVLELQRWIRARRSQSASAVAQ